MNFTEFRRTLDGITEIFGTNEFYNCTSEVESKVTVIEADVATDAQHCRWKCTEKLERTSDRCATNKQR